MQRQGEKPKIYTFKPRGTNYRYFFSLGKNITLKSKSEPLTSKDISTENHP